MSQYKLTYFNLNGVAEPIRWLLKAARVEFEDERIEFADWPQLKNSGKFPLGHIPLLEIDGQAFSQSGAIILYLAKKFGFRAGDELLDLKVDQVFFNVEDGVVAYRVWFREKDEQKKKIAKENLIKSLNSILGEAESIVGASGGKFIAGSKVTYADFVLANNFHIWCDLVDPSFKKNYPALAAQYEAVVSIPEIKAWIAVRPKVMF